VIVQRFRHPLGRGFRPVKQTAPELVSPTPRWTADCCAGHGGLPGAAPGGCWWNCRSLEAARHPEWRACARRALRKGHARDAPQSRRTGFPEKAGCLGNETDLITPLLTTAGVGTSSGGTGRRADHEAAWPAWLAVFFPYQVPPPSTPPARCACTGTHEANGRDRGAPISGYRASRTGSPTKKKRRPQAPSRFPGCGQLLRILSSQLSAATSLEDLAQGADLHGLVGGNCEVGGLPVCRVHRVAMALQALSQELASLTSRGILNQGQQFLASRVQDGSKKGVAPRRDRKAEQPCIAGSPGGAPRGCLPRCGSLPGSTGAGRSASSASSPTKGFPAWPPPVSNHSCSGGRVPAR